MTPHIKCDWQLAIGAWMHVTVSMKLVLHRHHDSSWILRLQKDGSSNSPGCQYISWRHIDFSGRARMNFLERSDHFQPVFFKWSLGETDRCPLWHELWTSIIQVKLLNLVFFSPHMSNKALFWFFFPVFKTQKKHNTSGFFHSIFQAFKMLHVNVPPCRHFPEPQCPADTFHF